MGILIEDDPNFEAFIRAFWRRIEPFKNEYGKELPEEIPIEFKCHMATAFCVFQRPNSFVTMKDKTTNNYEAE